MVRRKKRRKQDTKNCAFLRSNFYLIKVPTYLLGSWVDRRQFIKEKRMINLLNHKSNSPLMLLMSHICSCIGTQRGLLDALTALIPCEATPKDPTNSILPAYSFTLVKVLFKLLFNKSTWPYSTKDVMQASLTLLSWLLRVKGESGRDIYNNWTTYFHKLAT